MGISRQLSHVVDVMREGYGLRGWGIDGLASGWMSERGAGGLENLRFAICDFLLEVRNLGLGRFGWCDAI